MGKFRGAEARYNVVSVRLDDDMTLRVHARVPAGTSLSDFVRDILRRELDHCPGCGYPLDPGVGKYGCPNCEGGAL